MTFIPDRYVDEYKCVGELARALPWDDGRAARIMASTHDLLKRMNLEPRPTGGIDQFLKQYSLNTAEGLALVSLAECLLRIPDTHTKDLLLHDKITDAAWMDHPSITRDWMVRASRYGLSFTKATMTSLVSKLGAPFIRGGVHAAMRMMGGQFVLGETIEEAVAHAGGSMRQGHAVSFDMLGEGARTGAMADQYFKAYMHAIEVLASRRDVIPENVRSRMGISVKLSALHPRYSPLQEKQCRTVLTDRLLELAQAARRYDLTLTVDAEETERLALSLEIIQNVFVHSSLSGWGGMGLAVQAYQKYAPDLMDFITKMAVEVDERLRVRLVKGAYWDSEVKRAQVMGLPDYPVFTRKSNTDLSYLVCAQKLLSVGPYIYPMFATHNAHTACAVLDMARGRDIHNFEFQRLHGMGQALHTVLVRDGRAHSTIYAPTGTYEHLLAYLVRRLLENGANTSFVNQMADGVTDIADPYTSAVTHTTRRHRDLPLPKDLYGGGRVNSVGFDYTQDDERNPVLSAPVPNVQVASPATPDQVSRMIARGRAAFEKWAALTPKTRAERLDRYADLLEKHMGAFIHMLQLEGFKTLGDAVSEVREAVDFARYYACEVRRLCPLGGMLLPGPTGESNHLHLTGRGVFVCISPWNFPLAIFSGQVTAALAAGNTVVAKPAEQTPRVATLAVDLMHQAGIGEDVIQLAIGDGGVGAILTAHPDIAGVAFTGSTDVARTINRTLAARVGSIVPLIAETGGQNAMIVDSTALLETACDDIINSAFGSAGQRCSALRVLYVQHDIADALIALLKGALVELRVGRPQDMDTDVAPVIDPDAQTKLIRHTQYLDTLGAKLLARANLHLHLTYQAPYFAPCIYEIETIDQIPEEIFGPILHVIRFSSGDLEKIMRDIERTGYGLTFGLQTRLQGRVETIANRAPAGNVYVNRTMIGAVVGTQPFGGRGLSGTGPKAGGPHYLPRFMTEKVVTINTAAAGGNLALIAGGD
jgi:RHH-type proline utilization regulon transcriptional repressor/proline dehydrogenase/delta 1-pyrroline-5-carboxylate dehydrogenase